MSADLIADLSQNRRLQLHTLKQSPYDAALLRCLQVTQPLDEHV